MALLDFQFVQGKDSFAGDFPGGVQHLDLTEEQLASRCLQNNCVAFNTQGFMKRTLLPERLWDDSPQRWGKDNMIKTGKGTRNWLPAWKFTPACDAAHVKSQGFQTSRTLHMVCTLECITLALSLCLELTCLVTTKPHSTKSLRTTFLR